jgi:hypothetical protein
MTDIPVFFIRPTKISRRYLRRYISSSDRRCEKSPHGYHQAMVEIERAPPLLSEDGYESKPEVSEFKGDPRWPTCCEHCGHAFADQDSWQVFTDLVHVRDDTGEECSLRHAPVGPVWDAWWYGRKGDDGRSLVCKTPGGDWHIDGRASNCTMKDDDVHRCWVRHGRPEDGTLHVDKNGHTCAAGAGSIMAGSYHGFLHNGHLTSC